MTAVRDVYDYYGDQRPSAVFYDLVESLYRPIEPEVAFYLEMAKSISTPILEIGCGTGRISWSLAEAGHETRGIDIAPAMLDRARKKSASYPPYIAQRARFFLEDACSADLKMRYDLILAPYRVFNHLSTEAAQRAFLFNVKRHLSPEGRFVFDTTQPPREPLQASPEKEIPLIDVPHLGINFDRRAIHTAMDALSQVITTDFCYTLRTASGEVYPHVDRLVQRWVSPSEIRLMLDQAGFRRVEEYQDFDRSPPKDGEDRIWVAEAAGR